MAEEGVLHILKNDSSANEAITLISDDAVEGEEAFILRLTTSDGAILRSELVEIAADAGFDAGEDAAAEQAMRVTTKERSPGVWLSRFSAITLSEEDLNAVSEANGAKITLYSDQFTLSNPTKGALTQIAPHTYELVVADPNPLIVSAVIAELSAPLKDFAGIEIAQLFAEPIEEMTGVVPDALVLDNGKVLFGGPDLDVSFEFVEDYGMEFFGRITIANASENTLEDWELRMRSTFEVDSAAKVSITEGDDGWTQFEAPSWNSDLAPGESFTFGVNGTVMLDPADHILFLDSEIY